MKMTATTYGDGCKKLLRFAPSVVTLALALLVAAAPATATTVHPPGLLPGDTYHRVFVTSNAVIIDSFDPEPLYPANVGFPWIYGSKGADLYVSHAAENAGLLDNYEPYLYDQFNNYIGTQPVQPWKAILSTSGVNAKDHITVSGPIYNTNDELIANDAADLWDGSIANPINYTEHGNLMTFDPKVWTGTASSGQNSDFECGNWTSPSDTGTFGHSNVTDSWTEFSSFSCSNAARLYGISPPIMICAIGDADCDGDVDISGDILPAFSNFTGPGSTNRTRAEGDVEGGPDGNTPTVNEAADGDVDVSDLLTMFGNFTGPLDSNGGLVAAEAGDANIPDLIYDPVTGEVVLDVDGSGIIGYVLKNGDGTFVFGSHLQILAGVKTSASGELSEAAFASGSGSIGFVFPAGMDLAALTAYLTVNNVSRSLGAPVVPFDLVVLGAAVPEPAAVTLGGISFLALFGLAYARMMRRYA